MNAHLVPDRSHDPKRRPTVGSHGARHPLSEQPVSPVALKERNHSAPRHRAETTKYTHTGFEAGAL